MKTWSPEAQAAMDAGTAIVAGAIEILTDPPVRVWSGYGDIEIDGEVYNGIGEQGRVKSVSSRLGSGAQAIEAELTDVTEEVAALIDLPDLRGAPTVVYALIFDSSAANLLTIFVEHRGSIDRALRRRRPNGNSTFTLYIEGAARGLGRRRVRMRSNADQKLNAPDDTSFSRVSFAGERQLYLGGERPVTAATVNTLLNSSNPLLRVAGNLWSRINR